MTSIKEDIQKLNNLFPKGRLRRSYFILLEILSLVIVFLCMGAVMDHRLSNTFFGTLIWIVFFLLIFLQIVIVSKRLQDCGFIALFSLLIFVPAINTALILFLCVYPGQKGQNKFGADPQDKDKTEKLT